MSPISIQATPKSYSAQRVGFIAWSAIDSLFAECFPAPPSLPGVYPGVSNLYIDSVDIKPWATEGAIRSGSVTVYQKALATITYKTLDYDSSTLLSRRLSFSVDAMTLPKSHLKWDSDDTPIQNPDVTATKIIHMTEHSLTLHRQASVNIAAIRTVIGKVNASSFEGAAAETILFSGAEASFTYESNGQQNWSVDYRFHERRVDDDGTIRGWNYVFRPDSGRWDKPKNQNGKFLYETGDLSILL